MNQKEGSGKTLTRWPVLVDHYSLKLKPIHLETSRSCHCVELNKSKSWWLHYRFAAKYKMISLAVYPTITLVDTGSRRDDTRKLAAKRKDLSEVRKGQRLALQTESKNVVGSDEVSKIVEGIFFGYHRSIS